MRLSQFHELMNDEFGAEQAAFIFKDLVLGELSDRTAELAIQAGEDPRDVWLAICRASDVPKSRWHGKFKQNKKTN